jgi:hypothetical protein
MERGSSLLASAFWAIVGALDPLNFSRSFHSVLAQFYRSDFEQVFQKASLSLVPFVAVDLNLSAYLPQDINSSIGLFTLSTQERYSFQCGQLCFV